MEWLIYAALGGFAGFCAGLLGIGGGVIVGPFLVILFSLRFDDVGTATLLAIGTAISVIAVTSPVSAATHARQGNVDFAVALPTGAGAFAGALFGASAAMEAPAAALKFCLALFLLVGGFAVARGKGRAPANAAARPLPGAGFLLGLGAAMGAVSAALGIGGGVMLIPLLNRAGMPLRRAIGTATVVALPLALVAALRFAFGAPAGAPLPAGAFGYVYLPALLAIGAASAFTARYGAKCVNILPVALLRRLFGALMFVMSARLFWQTWQTWQT